MTRCVISKATIVALVVAGAACTPRPVNSPFDQEVLVGSLWMHHGRWNHAPPEIGIDELSAPATTLRFESNGNFAMVSSVVRRISGRTDISPGDGMLLSAGKWKRFADRIEIRYVKIEEDVSRVDGSDPVFGLVKRAVALLSADALKMDGVTYSRQDAPSMENFSTWFDGPRRFLNERLEAVLPEIDRSLSSVSP